MLSRANFITSDCSSGGEAFAANDIKVDPHDRFVLRIRPRACQISNGIVGLRFLLKGDNKHQLDLHISQMKYTGLNVC